MKTRTFYLTDRQIEALESLVKDTDMAMAEHVRRAIDDYLKNGNWLDWLEMEGKMSQRSAQRLIRIAEKFPNAPGQAHLNQIEDKGAL